MPRVVGKTGDLPGTKDLFDAACGSLFSCYQKYAEYMEGGVGGGFTKSMNALNQLTNNSREEAVKVMQNMLEGIF